MLRYTLVFCACLVGYVGSAVAQLPPDAVQLDKVKVSEKQKSSDLCPVHLVDADPDLATWTYEGVEYRGHTATCQSEFEKDPATYAKAARSQRWENNFVTALSTIWCPVTDEITPGGMLQWSKLGIQWESCCKFCDDSVMDEDFPRALERLKERAKQSYELTGGKYVEGASSPVEGAIKMPGMDLVSSVDDSEPEWLAGKTLEATYSGGVALIFENRCLDCHREGGAAPMKFATLGGIRQWRKNMKQVLETHDMPPWPASLDTGSFSNNRALSKKERDLLLEWIGAGYPPGDGEYKTTRQWNSEWAIGEPDAVLTLPDYTLPENLGTHVKEFTVETNFPEDRWIVASEIRPEDEFLVAGVEGGVLGSFYPGTGANRLPEGTGYLLKKGAKVTVRVLYVKEEGYEATDKTQIALKFGNANKEIKIARLANDGFTIPAEAGDHPVTGEYTIPVDSKIVSLLPNMRERGKAIKFKAIFPDGTEKDLLDISHWKYEWRYRYVFAEPLDAPKGTVIRAEATFDNSKMNANIFEYETDVKAEPAGEVLEAWIGYTTN